MKSRSVCSALAPRACRAGPLRCVPRPRRPRPCPPLRASSTADRHGRDAGRDARPAVRGAGGVPTADATPFARPRASRARTRRWARTSPSRRSRRPRSTRRSCTRPFDAATAEIRRIEKLMTTWRPTSEVSPINAAAGKHPVPVGAGDVRRHPARRVHASEICEGCFDITFESLHGLWKFDQDLDPHPPTRGRRQGEAEVRRLPPHQARPRRRTPSCSTKRHVRISLGGIAKGYAVDHAAKVLRDAGLDVVLRAGRGRSLHPRHEARRLAVAGRHPRSARPGRATTSRCMPVERPRLQHRGRLRAQLHRSTASATTTSSIPRTGYPATASRSVTIWAPTALLADAIDDAVFILGPQKGLALVESIDGVGAVIVDASNKVWTSKRLEGHVSMVHPPRDGI